MDRGHVDPWVLGGFLLDLCNDGGCLGDVVGPTNLGVGIITEELTRVGTLGTDIHVQCSKDTTSLTRGAYALGL